MGEINLYFFKILFVIFFNGCVCNYRLEGVGERMSTLDSVCFIIYIQFGFQKKKLFFIFKFLNFLFSKFKFWFHLSTWSTISNSYLNILIAI